MRCLTILLGMLITWSATALNVEVVGSAAINGPLAKVRENALKDAYQQASLRAGAQVSSQQTLNNGVLDEDRVSLRSFSNLKNVDILWEEPKDGMYEVAIRAEVESQAFCRTSAPNFRKTVAVTGFALAKPQQAVVGRLENIEQDLPHELINGLNATGLLHALDTSNTAVYVDPRRAPSVALATQAGAQYVITGVVRDLALAGEAGEKPLKPSNWLTKLGVRPAMQERQFAFDLYLYDGLSGSLLWQHSYQTSGLWDRSGSQKVGFATPDFWQTQYGGKVRQTLVAVVDDLNRFMRCQPFMTRIIKTQGNRVYIEVPTSAGVRPNDKFYVVRTGTFFNLDLEPRTELKNTAIEIIVKQVQPQFAIGEMKYNADHLAIQRDDLVVAW